MAVMVRRVENMATVIQKDAKCESACFGLFAAGYRKHVDPASNPTQIGVHSISQLIKQQGASAFFLKETGDTTIWAVRRLKAIGVPDLVIGKIVTTPPSNRTCRFPASGSRTRLHAFTHGTSCPSAVRRTSPKCP